jgi:hypothetical protein
MSKGELPSLVKQARRSGFRVLGGVNGGGWMRFASNLGMEGCENKSSARNFVRLKLSIPVGADAEYKHQRTVKAAKVAALAEKLKTPQPFVNPVSDGFLFSYEWRRVRMVALKKHGARCQCCGASPDTGAVMNVDHIKPRRLFPQLALDVDNLQVLCGECNHGKGTWDQTDWRKEETDPEVVAMLRDIARNG